MPGGERKFPIMISCHNAMRHCLTHSKKSKHDGYCFLLFSLTLLSEIKERVGKMKMNFIDSVTLPGPGLPALTNLKKLFSISG